MINEQFEILNESFEMTLAAYNGGESRMKRLQRRYKTGFWDQRVYYRVPRETREYVPRILAATWLFLHPEDYNLEFPVYQNELTELILKRAASLGELTICLGQVESANGWFRTRAVVFGNSSHLSFGLRIEDFVKSALVIVMSSRRHTRLPGPPVTTRSATANLWSAIVL